MRVEAKYYHLQKTKGMVLECHVWLKPACLGLLVQLGEAQR